MKDTKGLLTATVISIVILLGWQVFYTWPKQRELIRQEELKKKEAAVAQKPLVMPAQQSTAESLQDRKSIIAEGGRVRINADRLQGSISLKGARIDDLTLVEFRQGLEKDSPQVVLLSPSGAKDLYFAETGWLGDNIDLPGPNTIWKASSSTLTPKQPITLSWENRQKIRFSITIEIDDHYMFTLKQRVENNSGIEISLHPYGLINRIHHDATAYYVLHEGVLGVLSGTLEEITYATLKEEKNKELKTIKGGWMGITDKYWLTAFIPQTDKFDVKYSYSQKDGTDRFQADYRGEKIVIPSRESKEIKTLFFAGAKKLDLIEDYAKLYNIRLFDRAIDFGWYYFLTKPMTKLLKYFYEHVGNFGIAIMILTVLVKLVMFPIANKSYHSMSKMKLLHPEMMKLRDRYKDDRTKLNQEVMELYKREKINPLSGCLPLFIQIPVFFSLYKVIFITIEMRHAPFFGWIKDLSAQDPTTIFNLFGLIPWHPPAFMMIGLWPLIMMITMIFQQKMNPAPNDPVQAQMMRLMPFVLLFVFASFPAGLVIYWSWSNLLSIGQQYIISRGIKLKGRKK